jgi:hypothetical protein
MKQKLWEQYLLPLHPPQVLPLETEVVGIHGKNEK